MDDLNFRSQVGGFVPAISGRNVAEVDASEDPLVDPLAEASGANELAIVGNDNSESDEAGGSLHRRFAETAQLSRLYLH